MKDKNIFYYFGSHAHPYYEKLVKTPPKGINYISSIKVKRVDHIKKNRSSASNFLITKVLLPTFHWVGIPKIYLLKVKSEMDLIHSSQYLLLTNKPYVVDFEDISSLTWYDYKILKKKHVKWMIKRLLSSKKCVGIMPWSYAAKKSLMNSIPGSSAFEKKIKVVYPSYAAIPAIDRSKHKEITFLFVGKTFYQKGGLDTIFAFEKLIARLKKEKSSIRVKLRMVAVLPSEIKAKYKNNKNIVLYDLLPPEKVNEFYRDSDVFILPTHFDTFGFVYIEALAHGLPCIGVDNFASPEIITKGKTGFLAENFVSRFDKKTFVPYMNAAGVDSKKFMDLCMQPNEKTVNDLCDAMYILATDNVLRAKMSVAARNEVVTGKFSIARRNKLINDLYLVK